MAIQLIKDLQAKAARGLTLTVEETMLFVKHTRKSYLAMAAKVKTPKEGPKLSRNKVEQKEIDFF